MGGGERREGWEGDVVHLILRIGTLEGREEEEGNRGVGNYHVRSIRQIEKDREVEGIREGKGREREDSTIGYSLRYLCRTWEEKGKGGKKRDPYKKKDIDQTID